jgi:hypothetical protein
VRQLDQRVLQIQKPLQLDAEELYLGLIILGITPDHGRNIASFCHQKQHNLAIQICSFSPPPLAATSDGGFSRID